METEWEQVLLCTYTRIAAFNNASQRQAGTVCYFIDGRDKPHSSSPWDVHLHLAGAKVQSIPRPNGEDLRS